MSPDERRQLDHMMGQLDSAINSEFWAAYRRVKDLDPNGYLEQVDLLKQIADDQRALRSARAALHRHSDRRAG